MGVLKNLRHEKAVRAFVRLHIEGETTGHMWKAYKEAYPHVQSMDCLYVGSSRLFKRPEIQRRIRQVTKRMITRMDITEERILSKYEEAYELAKSQGKSGDMISASTAQAKLVGLLRDRIEAGAPGDFDNMENVSEVLDSVSKQVGPEAALALAQALGITTEPAKEEAAPEPGTAIFDDLEPPSGAVN